MRIALASDAWLPQVNGVVRTLTTVVREATAMGHEVRAITPDRFRTVPCPTYPEIRLALLPGRPVARMIDEFDPDAVHIATEGPLGMAARSHCLRRRLAFTTSFHTRFPEYVAARFGVPTRLTYAWLRHFHARASGVMVAAPSVRHELKARGFANIRPWSRGVDADLFDPALRTDFPGIPRPIFLMVSRVAVEKNIAAFLELDLPGSKILVGDGPQLAEMKRRFPGVHFMGHHEGHSLARYYASADVFVFPSLTDTFGLVLLEALAAGVPVAAYPVTGPMDVLGDAPVGHLDTDLRRAALASLTIPREACRAHALKFSWRATAQQFLGNLVPARARGAYAMAS
ncbi:MAG TPA: glycosyltransferase family 1 protein [Stellaceae bacterium]|nr:glycosyltransferase family 1 protein [Stellaceae bacterium]